MKRVLLVVTAVLCVAAIGAAAETPKPRPGAGGPRSDLANDEAIRKLYTDFTAAWNAHDPPRMASFWTLDGDLVEPDGATAKGRPEIEKHYLDEHAMAFKNTQLTLTVNSVWFITGDVALVDGTYVVSGAVDPNNQPLPPRKGLLTSVLLKEDGTWRVATSRSMIPIPLPWRPR